MQKQVSPDDVVVHGREYGLAGDLEIEALVKRAQRDAASVMLSTASVLDLSED